MEKIINDDAVLKIFEEVKPVITTDQLQIHIDYPCKCKIVQDRQGSSILPCNTHRELVSSVNKLMDEAEAEKIIINSGIAHDLNMDEHEIEVCASYLQTEVNYGK